MSVEDWGRALRQVAEAVGPAVVGVGRHRAGGSGVVIGRDRLLTNAHNAGPEGVRVSFGDGRVEESEVVGVDVDGDLVVLSAPTGDAPVAEWGAGAAPEVGSPVVALSNPGGRGLRATLGFVCSTGRPFPGPRGRRIEGSVEHTAPLPPGSSGSPLLDLSGRIVAVNTHRLGEGFYLAMPATAALQARVRALAAGQSPRGRRLGVGLAPVPVARRLRRAVGLPDAEGLLVRLVEEGSPAEAAGLGVGDLLVAAAGRPLVVVEDLHTVLDRFDGETLEIRVLRGTEERTVVVHFPG
ncbi:MAG: trypsin-like peptidase domain-containing protein [Acidimicrobiia bacterium]|nr:trypsin-like peptidase domain-containing protein [Acidimicrobiia bacterium]